jgi:hypothetical protein
MLSNNNNDNNNDNNMNNIGNNLNTMNDGKRKAFEQNDPSSSQQDRPVRRKLTSQATIVPPRGTMPSSGASGSGSAPAGGSASTNVGASKAPIAAGNVAASGSNVFSKIQDASRPPTPPSPSKPQDWFNLGSEWKGMGKNVVVGMQEKREEKEKRRLAKGKFKAVEPAESASESEEEEKSKSEEEEPKWRPRETGIEWAFIRDGEVRGGPSGTSSASSAAPAGSVHAVQSGAFPEPSSEDAPDQPDGKGRSLKGLQTSVSPLPAPVSSPNGLPARRALSAPSILKKGSKKAPAVKKKACGLPMFLFTEELCLLTLRFRQVRFVLPDEESAQSAPPPASATPSVSGSQRSLLFAEDLF